ncbi:MAG: LpqB family beta-propeller domain-containing protein, partial [Aquiluna sp.]
LAVASGSEQQTIVQVLGVIRDSTGRPVRLTQGLAFTPVLGEALAVSWNGATSLRVLEGTASGLTALSDYPLTGPRGQLNMPPVIGAKLQNGTTLISSYLLSDSSEVWVLSGNSWRRIQVGVLDISTGR